MAIYSKSSGGGKWFDKKLLSSGMKAKLITECAPVEGEFNGKPQTQHVAKMRVQGLDEVGNVALNSITRNGLVDAFGIESKDWVGKTLTLEVEKSSSGGKRTTTLYLLPEGYRLGEDENGYLVITKKETGKGQVDELPTVEYPQDESINPEDITFD